MGFRAGQAKGPSVSLGGGGGLAAVTTADSNSIGFGGDGTALNPLTADVVVDPASPLPITIGAAGLSVANPTLSVASYATEAGLDAIIADPTILYAIALADVVLTTDKDLLGRELVIVGASLFYAAPSLITISNGLLVLEQAFVFQNNCTLILEGCNFRVGQLAAANTTEQTLTIASTTIGVFSWASNSGQSSVSTMGFAQAYASTTPWAAISTLHDAFSYNNQFACLLSCGTSVTLPARFILSVADGGGGKEKFVALVDISGTAAGTCQITLLAHHNPQDFAALYVDNTGLVWVDAGPLRTLLVDVLPIKSAENIGNSSYTFMHSAAAAAPAVIRAQADLRPITSAVTKEPTGWDDPANVDVHYSVAADAWGAARTITLRAVSGSATLYWRGSALLTIDAATGWTSQPHAATLDVPYYLYYNGTKWSFGDAVLEIVSWEFSDAMAAFVYYGTNDKWALRECHGLMPYQSHREDHYNIGTYRRKGATDFGAVTFTPNTLPTASSPASVKRPSVAACELWDEDLKTINPAVSSNYCQLYLTGASLSTFVENQTDIVPFAATTTRAAWNNINAGGVGVWGLTALGNNEFGVVFVVEVPVASDATSQQYRKLFLCGQNVYATAIEAEAVSFSSLNLGIFFTTATEWLVTQRIVVKGSASNDAWLVQSTQQIIGSQATQISVASSGMVNPMTTTGDLIAGGTTSTPSTPTRIAAGAVGTALMGNGVGVLPSYQAMATSDLTQSAVLATWTGLRWLKIGSVNGDWTGILCLRSASFNIRLAFDYSSPSDGIGMSILSHMYDTSAQKVTKLKWVDGALWAYAASTQSLVQSEMISTSYLRAGTPPTWTWDMATLQAGEPVGASLNSLLDITNTTNSTYTANNRKIKTPATLATDDTTTLVTKGYVEGLAGTSGIAQATFDVAAPGVLESSLNGGEGYAMRIMATASGTISQIGFFASAAGTENIYLAIYADGDTGARLANATKVNGALGMNWATLNTPISVVAGAGYWLAVESASSAVTFLYGVVVNGGSPIAKKWFIAASPSATALPASLPAGVGSVVSVHLAMRT